jgi:hypothetical protein
MRPVYIQFLFFCLLMPGSFVVAQKLFPGYYISVNGDTVKGHFTNYRQWQLNPSSIEFNTGPRLINLNPADTREVSIAGKDVYVSYTGTRLLNPARLMNDMTEVDSASRFDTAGIFLRVVFARNNIKLLLFENSQRSNFYMQVDNNIYELIHKAYTAENSIAYLPLYRQQLLIAFEKEIFAKDMLDELNQLAYKEKDIIKLLAKITGGPRIKNKKEYPGTFVAEAGISVNHIDHLNASAYPVANASYKKSVCPAITIGYIFYNQRSFGKLFFSPQLKLYSYKASGLSKSASGYPFTTTASSGIMVNPIANIGYNMINKKALKWGIMLNAGIMISTKESILLKDASGQEAYAYYTRKDLKYGFGFQTRALLNNNVSCFASYMLPSKVSYFYGSYSNIQLGGGLIF